MERAMKPLAGVCVLLVAACAAPRVIGPADTITGKPIPEAEVKGYVVRLALAEWEAFGRQRVFEEDGVTVIKPVGVWEDEAKGSELVAKYWRLVDPDTKLTGRDCDAYWSAAFVSWVMIKAGVDPRQFAVSGAHRDYLRRIIANEDDSAFRLKPRRPEDYPPRPGDLICRGRGRDRGIADYRRIPDEAQLHCDIVVGSRDGSIEAIGGNVRNSVSLSPYPANLDGTLRAGDARRWLVVIENLYPEPPAPVAAWPPTVL
jgi:hypothetical protein